MVTRNPNQNRRGAPSSGWQALDVAKNIAMRLLSILISIIALYIGYWILGAVNGMHFAFTELNIPPHDDSLIMRTSGWFPAALLFLLAIKTLVFEFSNAPKITPYIAALTLAASFLTVRIYPEAMMRKLTISTFEENTSAEQD